MFSIQETESAQLSEWLNAPGEDPEFWNPSSAKAVVYCRTGARSAQVCAFLQQHGINQAVNLRGGIVDWYRRGLPIETPPAASLAV